LPGCGETPAVEQREELVAGLLGFGQAMRRIYCRTRLHHFLVRVRHRMQFSEHIWPRRCKPRTLVLPSTIPWPASTLIFADHEKAQEVITVSRRIVKSAPAKFFQHSGSMITFSWWSDHADEAPRLGSARPCRRRMFRPSPRRTWPSTCRSIGNCLSVFSDLFCFRHGN